MNVKHSVWGYYINWRRFWVIPKCFSSKSRYDECCWVHFSWVVPQMHFFTLIFSHSMYRIFEISCLRVIEKQRSVLLEMKKPYNKDPYRICAAQNEPDLATRICWNTCVSIVYYWKNIRTAIEQRRYNMAVKPSIFSLGTDYSPWL